MVGQIESRLSVALCTCNGERYLQEQLASINLQTIQPTEMIICDDCSVDQTMIILRKFKAIAPFPVQIKTNERRLGAAANFMQAIRMCQTEWVLLSDQDDIWMENRIACFISAIQANPDAYIIQSDGLILRGEKRSQYEQLWRSHHLGNKAVQIIQTGHAEKLLPKQVFLTGAAMAVAHRFAIRVPNPASGFLHDEWLGWFAGNHIRLIPEATFYYRQHNQQITGVDNSIPSQIRRLIRPEDHTSVSLNAAVEKYQLLNRAMLDASIEISAVNIQNLGRKIKFLIKRSHFGNSTPIRIFRICESLIYGHYWNYASGWRTLIKDLLHTDRL